MKQPDTLITLLGSNPLVPATTIKLLAKDQTNVFIIYTANTVNIFDRILEWKEKSLKKLRLEGLEVNPFNPEEIFSKLSLKISKEQLSGVVQFDTTGGTKQMMLGTILFLQNRIQEPERLIISYIVDNPWELVETDISTNKTITSPINLKYNIEEIISLHQTDFISRNPKSHEVRNQLSVIIANIVSTKESADRWKNWKRANIKKAYRDNKIKNEGEILDLTIDIRMFKEINSIQKSKTSFVPVRKLQTMLGFKSSQEVIEWFNGFWLETYVVYKLSQETLRSKIDDIKINIHARNPDFELDMVFLVQNRLYVVSISTTTDSIRGGKSILKKKIFEVLIRSRQIGGWKTFFGLVCLSDKPNQLMNEVQDYLVDRNVKVFGRVDLLTIDKKIESWIDKK